MDARTQYPQQFGGYLAQAEPRWHRCLERLLAAADLQGANMSTLLEAACTLSDRCWRATHVVHGGDERFGVAGSIVVMMCDDAEHTYRA